MPTVGSNEAAARNTAVPSLLSTSARRLTAPAGYAVRSNLELTRFCGHFIPAWSDR